MLAPGRGGISGVVAAHPELIRRLAAPLPSKPIELAALLAEARRIGLPPLVYKAVLQKYWRSRARARAGISEADWHPELGVDGNRGTVLKVYEYYRKLYQLDPALEWAGMANLVGPGFAAGFFDLDSFRDLARTVRDDPTRSRFLPAQLEQAVHDLADASDEQLKFFETTFLQMQRDIFEDMGAMHEAYLAGPDGIANIEEMWKAGLIREKDLEAWRRIDEGRRTGVAELLHRGAEGLADREQTYIIAGNWDAMREHPPMGQAVTYLMTVAGRPSLHGARFPGEVRPLFVAVTPDLNLPDYVDLPDLPNLPRVPWVGWDLPDLPTCPASRYRQISLRFRRRSLASTSRAEMSAGTTS